MASELILDLLMKQSANRLRQMGDDLRNEIRRLEFEVEYVERALAAKQQTRVAAASAPSATRSQNGGSPREPGSASRSGGTRPKSKREPILNIARQEPDRVWLPGEMRDRLASEGFEMTTDAVRVAMRRIEQEGIFQRGPDGQGFVLASRNGSHSGAGSGPTENGTSESLLTAAQFQEGT